MKIRLFVVFSHDVELEPSAHQEALSNVLTSVQVSETRKFSNDYREGKGILGVIFQRVGAILPTL